MRTAVLLALAVCSMAAAPIACGSSADKSGFAGPDAGSDTGSLTGGDSGGSSSGGGDGSGLITGDGGTTGHDSGSGAPVALV